MARTQLMDVTRDDDTVVTVEYSFRAGTSDTWMQPGDPAEVEIVKVFNEANPDIKTTAEEDEKFQQYILENHEDDYDDDY